MSRRKAPGSGAMVTDRVMVGLTVPERTGLDRITEAAKRAGYPLTEVDVMRAALDRLLADFDAAQQPPAAGTEERG